MGHGTVLAGRYRLEERQRTSPDGSIWRAVDETLERQVIVRILRRGHAFASEVVDAARRAALVEDLRLARVLDVGEEPLATYIVSEQVVGRTLADLLTTGPLPAETVRRLVGESAQALNRADSRGLHHLCLAPESVVVAPDGSVKLLGTAVDAAVEGVEAASPLMASRLDAVGLVAVLYAGLTGRWPGGPGTALAIAPRVAGLPVPPGDLVAGVPNDLDTLCVVTFGPYDDGPRSPRELAEQLAPWAPAEPLTDPRGLALAGPSRPIVPARPPRPDDTAQRLPTLLPVNPEPSRSSGRPVAPAARRGPLAPPMPPGPAGPPPVSPVPAFSPLPVGDRSRHGEQRPGRSRGSETWEGEEAVVLPAASAFAAPASSAPETPVDLTPEPSTISVPDPTRDAPRESARDAGRPAGASSEAGAVLSAPAPAPQVTLGPLARYAAEVAARAAAPKVSEPRTGSTGIIDGPLAPFWANRQVEAQPQPAAQAPAPSDDVPATLLPTGAEAWEAWQRMGRSAPTEEPLGPFSPPVSLQRPPRETSRLVIVVMVAFVLLGLASAAFSLRTFGQSAGAATPSTTRSSPVPPNGSGSPRSTSSGPPASTGTTGGLSAAPIKINAITPLDPQGDGQEGNARAGRAIDGDPTTTWRSDRYNSATFSGLKTGLGLLLDLGPTPAAVHRATVHIDGTGGQVELRTAPNPSYDGSEVVATAPVVGGAATLTVANAVTSRYLLVWFTAVPKAGSEYRIVVSEIELR